MCADVLNPRNAVFLNTPSGGGWWWDTVQSETLLNLWRPLRGRQNDKDLFVASCQVVILRESRTSDQPWDRRDYAAWSVCCVWTKTFHLLTKDWPSCTTCSLTMEVVRWFASSVQTSGCHVEPLKGEASREGTVFEIIIYMKELNVRCCLLLIKSQRHMQVTFIHSLFFFFLVLITHTPAIILQYLHLPPIPAPLIASGPPHKQEDRSQRGYRLQ